MRNANRECNQDNRFVTDARINVINGKATSLPKGLEDPIYGDIFTDLYTDGCFVQWPHGNVMQQGMKPFYYRGQVKDFGSCRSSLSRKILTDDMQTRKIKIFANNMRLQEFDQLIKSFKQASEWPFGTVFTNAIAQHYGFDTNIIDITNDLDVALFFACCKHMGNNKYLPLCADDMKSEVDKYGVLFIRDIDVDLQESFHGIVTVYPIGFQPFTRCHSQKGFFVDTEIDDDLQTSGKFTKYLFEHSPKFSQEIFNKFNGGTDLFGYDTLNEINDLISAIQSASSFSETSFHNVYGANSDGISESGWIDLLKSRLGVHIGSSPYRLSRQRIRAIDRKWSVDKFVKQEKISPNFRMVYTPP